LRQDLSAYRFAARFLAALVSFVGFFAACKYAPLPKALESKAVDVSLEMAVSGSDERDTDALVTNSGCDAPAEDSSEQKEQAKTTEDARNLSVFRILATASGTVFGSAASIVFFLNLFFINIGTNVVEGLVSAIFAAILVIEPFFECPVQVFMFFKNDLGASSSVLGAMNTCCMFF